MIVLINEPTNKLYYGGAVSAPVFKEVADKVYATQLEINPGIEKQYVKIRPWCLWLKWVIVQRLNIFITS